MVILMKRINGFTLIELLAVIVILAIIMVIAVPQILNIIDNSRESANNSSIKLIKNAIKTQITSNSISGNKLVSSDDCYTFNFDNDTNGNVSNLDAKNKDQFTGSITYCNGSFINDTLNIKNSSNTIYKNNNYIMKTKGLVCSLPRSSSLARDFDKVNDGEAFVGYYYNGRYTYPLLISEDKDAVTYYAHDGTYNKTFEYERTVVYNNKTYYVSNDEYAIPNNLTSLSGKALKLSDSIISREDAINLLFEKVFTNPND